MGCHFGFLWGPFSLLFGYRIVLRRLSASETMICPKPTKKHFQINVFDSKMTFKNDPKSPQVDFQRQLFRSSIAVSFLHRLWFPECFPFGTLCAAQIDPQINEKSSCRKMLSKIAPRRPRTPQDRPKTPPGPPQDHPQIALRDPKTPPHSPQEPPGIPSDLEHKSKNSNSKKNKTYGSLRKVSCNSWCV